MKKKGFVLMETIVVIVVISVALLSIFASYNKIMTKVKTENKYDTSEYIYATYHIKNHIKKYLSTIFVSVQDIALLNASNNVTNYENKLPLNPYGISNIYILTNLNNANKDNLIYFDAYMIDYIKKLDVRNTDQLILVEYKRPARDENYIQLKDSSNNNLYETYIASLEW